MLAEYWCNTDFRNKYFGYEGGRLVYVGTLPVTSIDDAFRAFNRIDETVPVLDAAEAPSMSVGDVVHMLDTDEWFAVARLGFDPIDEPVVDLLVRGRKVSEFVL